MKIVPKVQNWELMDDLRSSGACLGSYETVGLRRGWDDILVGAMDRRLEDRRRVLGKVANHLAVRAEREVGL